MMTMQTDEIHNIRVTQRKYFLDGHTRTYAWRKAKLRQLKKAILDNQDEILAAIEKDIGKGPALGFISETALVIKEIDHALRKLKKWMRPARVSSPLVTLPSISRIYAQPKGNVLVISPWNYPFQLALNPVVGAFAAGNTVILKPSELSPNTSQVLQRLAESYFEPEYLAVIQGDAAVSQELLSEKFDHIFFTGSIRVGKIVAEAAAKNLTPATLELGWKSPGIVDSDADIALAARRISFGKWLNAGQTCVAPDYLYVHEDVKSDFIRELEEAIKKQYYPIETTKDFGRVITKEHLKRLEQMMSGADILIGGKIDYNSLLMEPTVIDGVDWDHAVMQEEIFGPVLPVLSFSHPDEVVETLKTKEKPLATYIFSKNKQNIQKFRDELTFGAGAVNDALTQFTSTSIPFGGVGISGYGAYHGKYSFDTFTHFKGILSSGSWIDFPLRYPPFTAGKMKWISRLFGVRNH